MARLLIVDDEPMVRRPLRRTLERGGHQVLEAANVAEARALLEVEPIELVLCDVNMPGGSGLELVRAIADGDSDAAIVMLSGVDDPAVANEALAIGAFGYLVKPIGGNEALINVSSNLRRRELELSRRQYVEELESKVLNRTAALRDALGQLELGRATLQHAERDAVDRLVAALTIRSEETGAHIQRVGRYTSLLARRAGVNGHSEDEFCWAAMLHDVGKIGIPDSILLKAGPLDREERTIMKRHAALGSELLADGSSPVLVLGAQIALTHHERWDGNGYPHGVAGEAIPAAGRVAAIGDVFDALTSDRVYRQAMPVAEAAAQMGAERGRQFDPDLLDVFLGALDDFEAIRAAHPNAH